jgi:hypothetical protein
VTILEPTTTFTDLILAFMSFYFGHKLFHAKKSPDKRFKQFWALAFLFLGLSSFMGALAHGFPFLKTQFSIVAQAWPLTVMCMGIMSFYLLLALATEYFPRWRNAIFFLAYFKMMAFFLLMFGYPKKYFGPPEDVSFGLVIFDYAPVLILLLTMNVIDFIKSDKNSLKKMTAKTMVTGLVLSIMGTFVQVSGFGLAKNFNHNDIYHVIQMVAIYLMYRAVTLKRIA